MQDKRYSFLVLSIVLAAAGALTGARFSTAKPQGYVAHEWGTFTTVTGSDGSRLAGLEREEEALPGFVHTLDGFCGATDSVTCGKGFARPLEHVTVKLETPVLYFYSPEALDVAVDVGFRGGSLSQWYPQRAGGEAPPKLEVSPGGEVTSGAIDFGRPYTGSLQWNARVRAPGPTSPAEVLDGGETPTWIYPRLTDSNLVEAEGRAEKYLFYRGVGHFELPVEFRMPDDGTLEIANRGSDRVPFLLAYQLLEGQPAARARFATLPALEGGATARFELRDLKRPRRPRVEVFETLSQALTAAGLYRKEAEAMVQTWWKSYFKTPGLRVFWIVPRAFTDQVLPLRLDPAPRELIRVMVGRAEVLSPAFENQLRREYREAGRVVDFRDWDRFGKAYAERVGVLEGGVGEGE